MLKRLLEAIIAVTFEETVRHFITSLLPYVWFAILLGLTWEIINCKTVRDRAIKIAGGNHKMISYCLVAICGASLACFYWFGVQKAFTFIEAKSSGSSATQDTETDKKPKFYVTLFPDPPELLAFHKYKYPLRRYELMIGNSNVNSVVPTDFRIEFIFKNIIMDVKQITLVPSGQNVSVEGFRLYGKNKEGKESSYEEQANDTSFAKNFSIAIKRDKINDLLINTNILTIHCERWPRGGWLWC
jgi:hypothetical protein